jgi:hypothetical protein
MNAQDASQWLTTTHASGKGKKLWALKPWCLANSIPGWALSVNPWAFTDKKA